MKELTPIDVVNHGGFFQRTMRSASDFVKFCKERGIEISEERLEKFEKLGLFLPVLRIHYPEFFVKRKTTKIKGQPDKIEEFGILEDGEKWDGELRKDYSWFNPLNTEHVSSWIDEGLINVPQKGDFVPWSRYKDKRGHHKVQTYYSIFQVYSLKPTIERLSLNVHLENLPTRTEKDALKIHRRWKKHFRDYVLRVPETNIGKYWILCVLLSRRYLPEAESDGLFITVPAAGFTDFDFFEYRRTWNADEFLNYMEVSLEEIKKAWEWLGHRAEQDNPLNQWDDLVGLVKREKRERLKGDALLAETFKTMTKLLNLFYQDLTGEKLYRSYESPQSVEVFRGKGIARGDLRYKEFITNEFGVNPRPRLMLMVEGDGEVKEIPKFIEWAFGKPLSVYGIQIVNLQSIGEINSKKIVRFIDHFHDLQTIVYFILDNEGNSQRMRDKLIRTKSLYLKGSSVTKKELFKIWEKNIEFDNFSDVEIAEAMTNVSGKRYHFDEKDVNSCRIQFGKSGGCLSTLYKQKLSYDLDKPKLLKLLFAYFEVSFEFSTDGVLKKRPILEVVDNVRHLAMHNYQPTSLEAWTETQNSNWLRNKISPKQKGNTRS